MCRNIEINTDLAGLLREISMTNLGIRVTAVDRAWGVGAVITVVDRAWAQVKAIFRCGFLRPSNLRPCLGWGPKSPEIHLIVPMIGWRMKLEETRRAQQQTAAEKTAGVKGSF